MAVLSVSAGVVISVEVCDEMHDCVNVWGIYSVKPTSRHSTASALTLLISI